MKKLTLLLLVTLMLTGCRSADVASRNLSRAADEFEVDRRIVFYNGITSEYMLELVGRCSLGNYDPQGLLTVTCKTGEREYKKHFLGLSDNVTYFAEQIEGTNVDEYRYRVIFKPEVIIPNLELDLR
jgi:hypothetical protein